MQTATPVASRLSLSPLGAGDLIDRTVRLYRRHFLTLIRTAAPPIVGSAAGSVLWTVSMHAIPVTESSGWLVLYVGMAVIGAVLLFTGNFFFLLVMGGASRNLVMNMLWDEPVAARTIYRSVRARFWGLVVALFIIVFFASAVGGAIFMGWLIVVLIVVGGAMAIGGAMWLGGIIGIPLFILVTASALFLFFAIVGRAAYVPQVMLVEGHGVFEAVGRSITLARGNVRRLTAMFLFTTFATYSALMLFIIPLGWYGYLQGINPLNQAELPVWYEVGYQVLTQASSILLAPVWMLGLSLLYVDERVRHEGYDIELMAAQRLGAMPLLPGGGLAPLVPAISTTSAPRRNAPSQQTLNTPSDARTPEITERPLEITDRPLEITERTPEITDQTPEITERPPEITERPPETTERPQA